MAHPSPARAEKRARTYNTITAMILAITLVTCLVMGYMLITFGGQAGGQPEPTAPLAAGDATVTPTVLPPTPDAASGSVPALAQAAPLAPSP